MIVAIQLACSLGILVGSVAALVMLSRLTRHRRDDLTSAQLWFSGWRFYVRGSFKPEGHALQTRFFVVAGVILALFAVRTVLGFL